MITKRKGKQYKTFKNGDITYHLWEGKLHCWEGPALVHNKDTSKNEYYLYGIKYTFDEYKEILRNRFGLPPAHDPAVK